MAVTFVDLFSHYKAKALKMEFWKYGLTKDEGKEPYLSTYLFLFILTLNGV